MENQTEVLSRTTLRPELVVLPQEDNTIHQLSNSFQEYVRSLREIYLKNNRILLIQTPQFQFETLNIAVAKNRGVYAYPPTGLQCLAKALLEVLPLDIRILDLNYHLLKKIITEDFPVEHWLTLLDQSLEEFQPSVIGLTSLTAYNDVLRPTHPLTSLLLHLRERNKQIVVIGGPTATNEYEEYLRRGLCHFAILKEGEAKMRYLLSQLYEREAPAVKGITYFLSGEIQETSGLALRPPLSGNLIATYGLIPIESYHDIGSLSPYSRMAGMEKKFSAFQLNRGCRANCKFCDVSKFMGRGVRSSSVADLVAEIDYLVRERGIFHFEVLDDDFLGNISAVTELLNAFVHLRKEYPFTWSANNGLIAHSLTPEVLALLCASGCIGFRIGIESGNPEMIRKLRKPATLDILLKKGELIQQFPEMFIGANYILGLFGEETFAQLMDTFRFACKMNLDWASFSTFQVTSKETAVIEQMKSTGRVAAEFTPAKDNIRGEIPERAGIISGQEVFALSPEAVPSPEQVKQIWFTFNLVVNYINNKNLRPGGQPRKFSQWVDAVHVAYPLNPYMPLFSGLAFILLGEGAIAEERFKRAQQNVASSEYWKHRFQQFGLFTLVDKPPRTPEEVYGAVEQVRAPYVHLMGR